jgi:hypothetical protein
MTIERPMFPPRAVGCEIIQISHSRGLPAL